MNGDGRTEVLTVRHAGREIVDVSLLERDASSIDATIDKEIGIGRVKRIYQLS